MHYAALVTLYQQLESTTKRLQKTQYVTTFLTSVPNDELPDVLLLLQGRAFPVWDERTIGIADKLLIKAITLSTGLPSEKIEEVWKTTGDLGDAAAHCISAKKQVTLFSQPLTVRKVLDNLQKTATLEGDGTVDRKIQLIAELLTSATLNEARYLVRTFLEDLRVGMGEGSTRDAIVWSCFAKEIGLQYNAQENDLHLDEARREKYEYYSRAVQDAYDLTHDFAHVTQLARKGIAALQNITLEPGKPCTVMLYQKVRTIQEAFETVGNPAAFEHKYDGFRIQIHKKNNQISLFTRRLEDVTKQFPDVLHAATNNIHATSFIIDAEIVGINPTTGKYIPFQKISQRIKRKYDIEDMAHKFPVEINAFDLLFYNQTSLLQKPFSERRHQLSTIIQPQEKSLQLAHQKIISDTSEAETFYQTSLSLGFEGIMIKNLTSIYKPGSRVGYGVKLKPVMETLDVVITSAEWGEGKRSAWLSSFTIAVQNTAGELVEIGKVGTGIKEKDEEGISFNHLTELLKPHITKQEGKTVMIKPTVLIEVAYEEIQQSPTYSSGYALRFPRFVRMRDDKSLTTISTTHDLERFYKEQRGRDTP